MEHKLRGNQKLRKARQDQKWTIAEASERIGVDVRTYSRWEQSNITPRMHSLKRLCLVFEQSAEELGYSIL